MSQKQQKPKRVNKFIDQNQIFHLYKLTHIGLDIALKSIKQKIDEEFQDFRTNLISILNHLNYLRYMQAYPNDDIKFVFREKVNASLSETRVDQKEEIMNRMLNFQVIKQDHSGVSDNCLWELQNYLKGIEQGKRIFNFKQICPSGVTFLEKSKTLSEGLLTYWKQSEGNQLNLTSIFKEVSPIFPKQEIKKLGSILAQTNKSIISARLVFRASEHNFQSAVFKEMCGGIGQTLLIAKSDKGRIFGGYSAAKWLNSKQTQYIPDPTASSFLFSLDQNQVFKIKKNQADYAISTFGGWGPIYGSTYGPDLSISDKCHMNEHSCSSLGSHYQIPANMKEYSKEVFSLLAGAKNFKVVEYQVYQLVLQ